MRSILRETLGLAHGILVPS